MYAKSLIKLLATEGWSSIYHAARNQVDAGDSSIWYALKRLKEAGVVTENNELTSLGVRLSRLIEATEQVGISKEECIRRFGLDSVNTGRALRIIAEEKNVVTVTEIKDPLPTEVLLAEIKSGESDFAVSTVNLSKRFAGFFRPWPILLSLELSLEEKLELLGKWCEEYRPEVCTILSVGIPSAIA
ncbi:MAG TPA: hypothetical protein VK487_07270, partial [Candidatus Bathyarchaeia archaeon]|nr:hypothetical protein [Candidatus Bathyarchaeia archaeon]